MTILGIDTSSTDLSVCLGVDGLPVSAVCRYVRNSHAEHITQAVKTALELGSLNADDVTHIAVSAGPGSFTGLRIGLSFVKGFCMMAERKVIPLSSLMTLAHAAGCRQAGQHVFAALDARQGNVHWGSFIWDAQSGNNVYENSCHGNDNDDDNVNNGNTDLTLRRLTDDRLSSPDELLEALSANDILITDTMGYSRSTVFAAFVGKAEIVNAERTALTRAASCAALAFDRRNDESLWMPADRVVPNYLQPPPVKTNRS